jgi:hypothetical protein
MKKVLTQFGVCALAVALMTPRPSSRASLNVKAEDLP